VTTQAKRDHDDVQGSVCVAVEPVPDGWPLAASSEQVPQNLANARSLVIRWCLSPMASAAGIFYVRCASVNEALELPRG
jgi:hypothetical protein